MYLIVHLSLFADDHSTIHSYPGVDCPDIGYIAQFINLSHGSIRYRNTGAFEGEVKGHKDVA